MKTKIALAISTALMTMSTGAIAQLQVQVTKPAVLKDQLHISASKKQTPVVNVTKKAIFTPEKNLAEGKYRYIVQLIEAPAALYEGGIKGYKATALNKVSGKKKYNVNRAEVKAYRSLLAERQTDVITQAENKLGKLDIKQRNTLAFNGFVTEMTQAEAQKLASVAGIAHIQREVLKHIQTDSGPKFIKADKVWDGSANGTASKGEGMLVGIIDTGVNTDHPSFADVGADGYDHTNPFGSGNYIGDCATEEWASLCNDKLVGVVSYPEITQWYPYFDTEVPANGEDHNGHGSHTASTTAGNILHNVNSGVGALFDAVSGVAPHANIISYQVCLPGEDDAIGFAGCYPSLTVLAVENAIENGVDALNYSIGGGSSDPWHDADGLAFLSARKAGIHVATSAGNSGPGPETVGSPGDAPWITTVAAASHDRTIKYQFTFDQQTFDYVRSTGPDFFESITTNIKYAGDVDPLNFEGCNAFAENSFSDAIALISRGSCAFADKVNNAEAAGAKAVIIFNNKDGDVAFTMGGLQDTSIASVMISENAGMLISTALKAEPDMLLSLEPAKVEHTGGGVLAGFSSRGPNKSVPDVIAPSITAPGLSIFAAYADSQSAGFKENPDPSDFAFLQGTSMASPHIAGALTLLAKIHPDWTPAETQSALMLTANQNTLKEDGVTPADFFDMGSGYANVAAAAASGLVMDESIIDYLKADPGQGGQPKDINLPTMANAKCVGTCTWTRSVKATSAATWITATESLSESFNIQVTPASFTLAKGETQTITITADVTEAAEGWNFGNIVLTSEGLPEARMPIAAKADGNNFPNELAITGHRDQGSITFTGLMGSGFSNPTTQVFDKQSPLFEPITMHVPDQDIDFIELEFTETVPYVSFNLSSAVAPDVDLYIRDSNFVLIGASTSSSSNEQVTFTNLAAGVYYIVAQSFENSSAGSVDEVTLTASVISPDTESLSSNFSAGVTAHDSSFDLTFNWTAPENGFGVIQLMNAEQQSSYIPFNFARGDDDITFSGVTLAESLTPGQAIPLSYTIAPNLTQEDKVYNFAVTLSEAGAAEIANVTGVNAVNTNGAEITWSYTQKAGVSDEAFVMNFNFIPRKGGNNHTASFSQGLGNDMVASTTEPASFGVVEVAPMINITAPASVTEGSQVTLDASASTDANNDALTYSWKQLSGTPVSFNQSAAAPSFTAPQVNTMNETMSFELTISDGNGNVVIQTATFEVRNKKSSGSGSFGWLLLASPLVWLRRKLAK